MNKDILKDYQGLLLEEKQLQELLKTWETKAASTNRNINGMPIGNSTSDSTSQYAIKIAETKGRIESKHMEIADALLRIELSIEGLRPLYRYIIREYYIFDKKWEQIAIDTNYSVQHIWRIHGEALKLVKT